SCSALLLDIGNSLVAGVNMSGVGQRHAEVSDPVVLDARIGAVLQHRRAQRVQVGGPASLVDVEPVGLVADRDHVGAGTAQRLRGDPRCRTVGAVHNDFQPVQAVGQGVHQVGDVAFHAVRIVGDPADVPAGCPRHGTAQPPFDLVFHLV